LCNFKPIGDSYFFANKRAQVSEIFDFSDGHKQVSGVRCQVLGSA
jgi:hypothetical protein